MTFVPAQPSGTAHDATPGHAGSRLSQPAADVLVPLMARSLADRLTSAPEHASRDRTNIDGPALVSKTAPDWGQLLRFLDEETRLDLARHALNAALETLDADPTMATELLPGTTAAVRAQIARGCLAEQDLHAQGFMIAEVDIVVWEQLLRADRRAMPIANLEPHEAAERRRVVLAELGIAESEVGRYRRDLRISAVPDLTGVDLVDQVDAS